jgi:hypothetical protein
MPYRFFSFVMFLDEQNDTKITPQQRHTQGIRTMTSNCFMFPDLKFCKGFDVRAHIFVVFVGTPSFYVRFYFKCRNNKNN